MLFPNKKEIYGIGYRQKSNIRASLIKKTAVINILSTSFLVQNRDLDLRPKKQS